MGISPFSKSISIYDRPSPTVVVVREVERKVTRSTRPNPNPKRYTILKHARVGSIKNGYLLLKVRYPDATNYEGVKILLFKGTTLKQLKAQGSIDPHFSASKRFKSPIARFEPTTNGWEMGMSCAEDEWDARP